MVTTILTHEVKSYSEWKKVFDADGANRDKMGVKITGVFKDIDNPNKIVVTSEVPSAESIKGFLASPDLKAAMEKGGVIGAPSIQILNKVA